MGTGAILSPTGRESPVVLVGDEITIGARSAAKQLEAGTAVAREFTYEDWENKPASASYFIMAVSGGEVSLGPCDRNDWKSAFREVLRLPPAKRAAVVKSADAKDCFGALHLLTRAMSAYPEMGIEEAAALYCMIEE